MKQIRRVRTVLSSFSLVFSPRHLVCAVVEHDCCVYLKVIRRSRSGGKPNRSSWYRAILFFLFFSEIFVFIGPPLLCARYSPAPEGLEGNETNRPVGVVLSSFALFLLEVFRFSWTAIIVSTVSPSL